MRYYHKNKAKPNKLAFDFIVQRTNVNKKPIRVVFKSTFRILRDTLGNVVGSVGKRQRVETIFPNYGAQLS